MKIDLRKCKPDDILISSHGVVLKYKEYRKGATYPHDVTYPDGSLGSRIDDGHVFAKNRLPKDEDIVFAFHPWKWTQRNRHPTKEQLFGAALVARLEKKKVELPPETIDVMFSIFEEGYVEGWRRGLPY